MIAGLFRTDDHRVGFPERIVEVEGQYLNRHNLPQYRCLLQSQRQDFGQIV
jgi:hypothetical protein